MRGRGARLRGEGMRKVVGCKGGWYGIMSVLCMR